jgi:hypothetical protein
MRPPAELSHRSAARPHVGQLDLQQEGVLAVIVSNLRRNAGDMMEFIGALRKGCRSMSGSGSSSQRRRRRREKPQQSELHELECKQDGREIRKISIKNESLQNIEKSFSGVAGYPGSPVEQSQPASLQCLPFSFDNFAFVSACVLMCFEQKSDMPLQGLCEFRCIFRRMRCCFRSVQARMERRA